VAGVWESWGLGLSFAPPTKSFDILTDNDGLAEVIFDTPFSDDHYTVGLTCFSQGGRIVPVALLLDGSKTKDGFKIKTVSAKTGLPLRDILVTWLATKHHP
jgi:hypothetical protein